MKIPCIDTHDLGVRACSAAQSCPTLCDPMDYSLSGSSAHGILQARILEFHFLLQGIFLTQGSNPCLLHLLQWQVGSLLLSYLGSNMSWASCWKSFVFPPVCHITPHPEHFIYDTSGQQICGSFSPLAKSYSP